MWKKFPRKKAGPLMRFFSQAKSLSRLMSDTSVVALAADRSISVLFRAEIESWRRFSNKREHDETGFDRSGETSLARVLPTSPAHSGCCGLPP
jgi:hypothetical protein